MRPSDFNCFALCLTSHGDAMTRQSLPRLEALAPIHKDLYWDDLCSSHVTAQWGIMWSNGIPCKVWLGMVDVARRGASQATQQLSFRLRPSDGGQAASG